MKKTINITVIFSIIASILLIILSVLYFQQYHYINFDDLPQPYPKDMEDVYRLYFSEVLHGRTILMLLYGFFTQYIPFHFNIHQSIWAFSGNAFVKAIWLVLISYLCTDIIYLKKSKDVFFGLYMLIFYIFWQINFIGNFEDWCYHSFYSYNLPFLFFFLFWNIFLKIFFTEDKPVNKKQLALLITLGIINTTLTEYNSICIITALIPLLFIYKKSNFTIKQFLILCCTLWGGGLFFFTGHAFIKTAVEYNALMSVNSTINSIKENIIPFIKTYCQFTFEEILVYLIIMGALLFILRKNKNIYKISFVTFSLVFSAFCFHASLILSGYPCEFLRHFDLVMCFKIYLFYCIYFLFGFIKTENIKPLVKYITVIFSCILLLLSSLSLKNINYTQFFDIIKENGIKDCILIYYDEPDLIKERYLNERIMLYYFHKNIKPIYMYHDHAMFPQPTEENISINYFNYNYGFNYDGYELLKDIKLTETIEEAYNQYLKDNGPAIFEEEINEHDFNKLLDKELILYGKKK